MTDKLFHEKENLWVNFLHKWIHCIEVCNPQMTEIMNVKSLNQGQECDVFLGVISESILLMRTG